MATNPTTTLKIYLFVIGVMLLAPILVFIFYRFEKKITIKKVDRFPSRYLFEDTNGNVYKMINTWFLGEFDKVEDYYKLEVGKSYHVKGYGFRIKFLDKFPSVYSVEHS